MRFELTGEPARQRDASCKTCGSLRWCDECWDHVRGYSPFVIWHCRLCRMPTFFYEHTDADVMAPKRCDYCGWDEATECTTLIQGTRAMPTNPFKSLNEPEDVSLPQRNVESINEPTPPTPPDIQPALDFLEPGSCMIGDADFTLFVHGTNFFPGSIIHFAGHDEPSTLNVDGTLSTGVKPSLWASPVVVEVKVRNGSLTSAPLPFEFLAA